MKFKHASYILVSNNATVDSFILSLQKCQICRETLKIHAFETNNRANLHPVHIKLIALCFATFSAECNLNHRSGRTTSMKTQLVLFPHG